MYYEILKIRCQNNYKIYIYIYKGWLIERRHFDVDAVSAHCGRGIKLNGEETT